MLIRVLIRTYQQATQLKGTTLCTAKAASLLPTQQYGQQRVIPVLTAVEVVRKKPEVLESTLTLVDEHYTTEQCPLVLQTPGVYTSQNKQTH